MLISENVVHVMNGNVLVSLLEVIDVQRRVIGLCKHEEKQVYPPMHSNGITSIARTFISMQFFYYPDFPESICSIVSEFKLLKVLDVLTVRLDFSGVIPQLVHLKYVAARIKGSLSLAKLRNLQTIILRSLERKELLIVILEQSIVEVILEQSIVVNSQSDGVYRTSGGETIVADCYFLCTGTLFGTAWLKETILKDSLDSRGRVMVDSNLRIKGRNNIFAIGDITDVPELKQGYLAQEHAKAVAKNITSLIKGVEDDHKLAVYKPATKALAIVSLGRKDAVAQFPCLSIAGRVPGMIKSGDLFVGKTRKGLGLQPGV